MKHLRLFLIACGILQLCGCFLPANQPWLWRTDGGEVPKEILLSRPIVYLEGKYRDNYEIPAGRYELWHENKFGYYFRQSGSKIAKTTSQGRRTEFEGGFQLAKREDSISIYHLMTIAEDRKALAEKGQPGELSTLAAWEAGDNDGMARKWVAGVPREVYGEFGFPAHQLAPK